MIIFLNYSADALKTTTCPQTISSGVLLLFRGGES